MPRVSAKERIVAGVVAVGLLAVLVVGAWVTPDGRGYSTHEQLGLPPCGFHVATGRPCATCGMTTAFTYASHAQPGRALVTQPMGAAAALGSAAAFWGAVHIAVFGSRLGRAAGRLMRPRVVWSIAALWAASWAYTLLTW